MASSGLITPVTGRKYVKSWMIDEFIASAIDFYSWTESLLQDRYFTPVEIVRFLSHPEALNAWESRLKDPDYHVYISDKRTEHLDKLNRPYGIITGGYRLDARHWLNSTRDFLKTQRVFIEEEFSIESNREDYAGIIYATGASNPLTSAGLIPNKGEALIVKMPDWKFDQVIKEDVFFVPLKETSTYWVGSYYEPWPNDINTTLAGKQMLIKAIEEVYRGSYTILEHISGIRPTVDDRRPLVGPILHMPGQYMFNGMGTKGTSLAPYWADQLISHLEDGVGLPRIVAPSRYAPQEEEK